MGSSASVPASEKVKSADLIDQTDNTNNMDDPANNNDFEVSEEDIDENVPENVPENDDGSGNEDDVDMDDPVEEPARIPTIVLKYKCFPLSSYQGKGRNAREISESHPGSLILHNEALQMLMNLQVPFPLAFQVHNPLNSQITHCGVSEFTAKKGICYVPDWIMINMGLIVGQQIFVKYVQLPLGNTVLLEPQSIDFLQVTDPKALLQNSLDKFHCVSAGDIVPIVGEGKTYKMKVLKTEPADAICIRDCDLTVDFVKPLGYVEPKFVVPEKEFPPEDEDFLSPTATFVPFSGAGYTLGGKTVPQSGATKGQRGIPDHKWEVGNLNFMRKPRPLRDVTENVKAPTAPFEGTGFTLGSRPTNTIEHPPPDFDPSDEAPAKKQRLDNSPPTDEEDLVDDSESEDDNEMEE